MVTELEVLFLVSPLHPFAWQTVAWLTFELLVVTSKSTRKKRRMWGVKSLTEGLLG